MSLPNKPHDHLFKSTFSDPRIAADYIRNFLPTKLTSKLDLATLKLAPTSYVNEELKEYLSDVVYRCKYGQEEIKLSLLIRAQIPTRWDYLPAIATLSAGSLGPAAQKERRLGHHHSHRCVSRKGEMGKKDIYQPFPRLGCYTDTLYPQLSVPLDGFG